ncbi:hypothetical protein [Actinopolyspora alba]|nr:hypothetical protein [Actinopolyspora alba]
MTRPLRRRTPARSSARLPGVLLIGTATYAARYGLTTWLGTLA